ENQPDSTAFRLRCENAPRGLPLAGRLLLRPVRSCRGRVWPAREYGDHEASAAFSDVVYSTRVTLDRVMVIFTPLSSSMRTTSFYPVGSTETTVPKMPPAVTILSFFFRASIIARRLFSCCCWGSQIMK